MFGRENEYKSVVNRIFLSLILFIILFYILTFAATLIGEIITIILPDRFFDTAYIISEVLVELAYVTAFVIPVPLFYLISNGQVSHPIDLSLNIKCNKPISTFYLCIFAGLAIMVSMSTVNSFLFPVSYYDSAASSIVFSSPYVLVLSFISSAVIPAFVEELLFRGLIISNLKPYGKSVAVIISSLAFGLMHQNPIQLFFATIAGLVLGIVYIKTESIWCVIAIHFANNLISVIQTYLFSIMNEDKASFIIYVSLILLVIVGGICGIILLHRHEQEKSESKENEGYFGRYDLEFSNNSSIALFASALKTTSMIIYIIACVSGTILTGITLL